MTLRVKVIGFIAGISDFCLFYLAAMENKRNREW